MEYVKIEWGPLRVEVLLHKRCVYRGNVLSYARIITFLGNIYKEMFIYSDNITTDLALKTSFLLPATYAKLLFGLSRLCDLANVKRKGRENKHRIYTVQQCAYVHKSKQLISLCQKRVGLQLIYLLS